MKNKVIIRSFQESLRCTEEAASRLAEPIAQSADVLSGALRGGRRVYVFGNGGSASDAQHIAGELVGRFLLERAALPAVALSTDTSILTAVANDLGYEQVFARQLEALGREGDVAVALSTSGNSPNIVVALQQAKRIGMRTIVLTGRGGGRSAELADILLDVDSDLSPRIQETHAVIYHILCELVEARCAGE
ncbi:MAG: D-sedoheptulose-7-phosphate isomerase [Planctomycetota bacterium]